jgi:hypothetical protein
MNKKRWIDFYFQLIYITSERVEGSKAICYLGSFMHSVILGCITEQKQNQINTLQLKLKNAVGGTRNSRDSQRRI